PLVVCPCYRHRARGVANIREKRSYALRRRGEREIAGRGRVIRCPNNGGQNDNGRLEGARHRSSVKVDFDQPPAGPMKVPPVSSTPTPTGRAGVMTPFGSLTMMSGESSCLMIVLFLISSRLPMQSCEGGLSNRVRTVAPVDLSAQPQ